LAAGEPALLVFPIPSLRGFFCPLRGFFYQLGGLFLRPGTHLFCFYFRAAVEILPAFADNLSRRLPLPAELLHLADYFAHLLPVVCAVGLCKLIHPSAKVLLYRPGFRRRHRRSRPACIFHTHRRFRPGLVAAFGPFSSAALDVASFYSFASFTNYGLSFSRSGWIAKLAFTRSVRVSFLGD
jgi:hypothetical protein